MVTFIFMSVHDAESTNDHSWPGRSDPKFGWCTISPRCSNRARCRASRQVGLDPIASGPDRLRWGHHYAIDTRCRQGPSQPEPGRASLIGHCHRTWQTLQPFQDLVVLGGQPAVKELAGFTIQPARNYRSCVHIQSDTRTLTFHWGLPHLWLYRPGPPCRQPTFTYELLRGAALRRGVRKICTRAPVGCVVVPSDRAGRCWWGVSVDPGLSVLPVSAHVSLGGHDRLSTGTVECCLRARVSDSCFTRPPRNTHPHKGIAIRERRTCDGCDTRAVRGDRLLEEGRQGLCPNPGAGPTQEVGDGVHLGARRPRRSWRCVSTWSPRKSCHQHRYGNCGI